MTATASVDRRARAARALVPLFFVSGATSLVYETLWARQLHWVFGTSQLAITTVLAGFMAGLAGGGFVGARIADRTRRPVALYAALEAFIGLYALVFPVLLGGVAPIYKTFWRHVGLFESPLPFFGAQLVLVGALFLPPTMAMGATLPLLARFATDASEAAAKHVGRLYGANTLGAVLGTAIAGFVLLPKAGLENTTWLAAGANLALALVAGLVARRGGEIEPAVPLGGSRPLEHARTVLGVAFVAGFTSLVYEVAWFRVLTLILGASVYAFTIMLLAFLVGISIGGWAGGPVADRVLARRGASGVLAGTAVLQAGIAVSAWAVMYAYGELPFTFTALYGSLKGVDALDLMWIAKIVLALLVMIAPTILMGATFPFLVRAGAGGSLAIGRPVGRIYGTNTLGAILGASLGSLVLLPMLSVRDTVLCAAFVNLLAALVAMYASQRARARVDWRIVSGWAIAVLWAVAFVHWRKPPWDPLVMTAGMYQYVGDIDEYDRQSVLDFAVTPYDLLFYEEGVSSVVTVARAASGNMWLANNGKVDASTSVDMPTQLLVAHLPFAFHPKPKRVALIGLASGITAGAITLHDDPGTIEIVELEPAVVRASHQFDEHNHRPLEDGRVRLSANDGRNHLYLADDETFDIVVSEPSNPWLSGVSNLFTKDFLEMGKRKLTKGGVWAHWIQLYGMDTADVRSLLGTFADVYPYVALFSTIRDADLVMIGSDHPLDLSARALDAFVHHEDYVEADLAQIGIESGSDLLARYQMDRPQMLALAHGVERNTDDNMRIEYSAPLHLYDDTAEDNFRALFADVTPPLQHVEGVPGRVDLAKSYAAGDDWVNALLTLKDAHRLQPDSVLVQQLYDEYQAELQAALAGDDAEAEPADDGQDAPDEAPDDETETPSDDGAPQP
jgi:spermidine synthase